MTKARDVFRPALNNVTGHFAPNEGRLHSFKNIINIFFASHIKTFFFQLIFPD